MEYVEKELAGKPVDPEAMDLTGMVKKMAKIPRFLLKILLKKNIKKIREAMGGDSRDITTRPIITKDEYIPGYKSQVRIQIYSPETTQVRPLLVFFHGGGWIGGSLPAVEDYCKGVSDQADCVVISVDYHLAPEYPFPEGLEDSYAAIKWAVVNKDELNINLDQIVVAGDSAGGNFAAVICLMARERNEFSIAKQILIYTATNLVDQMIPDDAQDSPFPPGMMKVSAVMVDLYFKGKVDKRDPYISPVYAKDLSNLPPALIAVGDQDFLYKSSLEYAKKLDEAGNKVKFLLYKNANHAFIDDTGNSDQANDLVREAAEFIRN